MCIRDRNDDAQTQAEVEQIRTETKQTQVETENTEQKPITLPQGSREVKTEPSRKHTRKEGGRSYSFVAVGDNVVHTGIWLEAKQRAQGREGREYWFAPVFDEIADMIRDACLLYTSIHRYYAGCDIWYFSNTTTADCECTVTLRGRHTLEEWNPHTGRIRRLQSEHDGGRTKAKLTLPSKTSVFWVSGSK